MNSEIIEKLPLLSGKGMWHTNDCNGRYPSLHLSDGPHGLRRQEESAKTNNDSYVSTCYPTASCLAATWDPELVGEVADSIGKEAKEASVSVVLGPGVNIKRSPLCGRNFEYFSEDPLLAGKMGTAYVKGVQQNGVGTSLKHFAANSQETRRMTSNSRVDERTLREIYLSAFEQVVKEADPATIMASYNYLNGYKVTENRHLLTEILRDDWGYEGVVVSDWGACIDLSKAVKAGMDLEMPNLTDVHNKKLKEALEAGEIEEADVGRAIKRIEKMIAKYASENLNDKETTGLKAHDTALKAALSGAVLLKNENGFLPLMKNAEINVIGELARTVRFQGGGSSHINTAPQKDIVEELEAAGFKVHFAPGYRIDTVKEDYELRSEALELVKNGFPILFCGGLTDLAEGEGYDRKTLDLPENQLNLMREIQEDKEIIFLSFGGSPFAVPFKRKIKAMLHMYLGGEAVAKAAVMLLSGEKNPSGKLAESWPYALEDTPAYGNFAVNTNEIFYKETLFVGYRHYDTNNVEVQFPFGFGLSYTTFEYSDLRLSSAEYDSGELIATFKVKNTGSRAGAEVTELYVENPEGRFPRARHELRGFKKVFLKPGEEKEVSITINERAFSVFDTALNRFNVAAGDYVLCVGGSLTDLPLRAKISVKGKDYEADPHGTTTDLFIGKNDSNLDVTKPGHYSVYNSLNELSKKSLLGRIMLKVALKVAYSMFDGKPHDDPEVMMTVEGVKDGPLDCVIMQSGGVPYWVAEAIVKQANRKKR
ncbi:MAG: glycoside hydrolase family 3 C-terminal domain-containing protein [Lachnospiraceae bacterium]|nr:glycoside hydrolase family 3 C-terminal domain-containing protein [Lachnospiraceae bacterium]